jgi:RNA polymerase sigma-70 factor (ECF subfamily)
MNTISENQLLNDFKTGRKKAFNLIFNRYWEELFIFAFNILKDEDIAKDVVQEVFISVWNRRNESNITNLKAYLYQSVKFQTAKVFRDNSLYERYSEVFEIVSNSNSVEQNLNAKELALLIEKTLLKLPEKCAEVFHLSRDKHLSNKEVADKLNISVSTVENQINKALRIIKSELKEYSYIFLILGLFF